MASKVTYHVGRPPRSAGKVRVGVAVDRVALFVGALLVFLAILANGSPVMHHAPEPAIVVTTQP